MRRNVIDRLGDKFVFDQSGCWLWTAARSEGYGRLNVEGRGAYAHRVLYELLVGPIPQGFQIDHLCRVRNCVNPAHMETVTSRENTIRGDTLPARNLTKTHCPNGHPYDAVNTRITGGKRYCRTCVRNRWRAKHNCPPERWFAREALNPGDGE